MLATAALLCLLRQLSYDATAALWVRNQTPLKNSKWATQAKEWPTHCSPPKKYTKKDFQGIG
jgi:hypothetical protein